jgi:outer membrane protein OmpA-like peptidoglycan-associated protein
MGGPALAQSDTREVVSGATTELAVAATDADGDPLTFTWSATGGRVVGSGPRVTFESAGLAPGSYEATVTVSDSICEVSKTFTIRVVAPAEPPPLRAESLPPCAFPRNAVRVTNACKSILDDAAVRLRSNPTYQVVVDGHAEPGERAGISFRRAEAARDYLVNEQGIDAARVVVRPFDERCPAGAGPSGRIEVHLLPEGMRADDIRKNCP